MRLTGEAVVMHEDLDAVLRAQGVEAARIQVLSPAPRRKRAPREAYLVDTVDGGRLKLRRVGSEQEAERLCELRDGLEPAFAPVLASHGAILVEEWVDGTDLLDHDSERWAEEAGAVAGRLHVAPLDSDVPERRSSREWRRRAASDLEILGGAGRLSADETASLERELGARDPGSARSALIHRDYCAENMVLYERGRLRVIDNEWLMIGPAEFDLARTMHRWPMSDAAWERFRGAHSSSAPAPEAFDFWILVAMLFGARVLHQWLPDRLEPLLAQLRRYARR
jgi:thiamine kinase-like enzyme